MLTFIMRFQYQDSRYMKTFIFYIFLFKYKAYQLYTMHNSIEQNGYLTVNNI